MGGDTIYILILVFFGIFICGGLFFFYRLIKNMKK